MWQLAWPSVALNGLQTLNSLLDSFFIGRLERSALVAHGAALNVIFMLFSLVMTISVASTALVARSYGAEDMAGCRSATAQCSRMALYAGFLLSGLAVLLALFVAPQLVPAEDERARQLLTNMLLCWAPSLIANGLITTLAGSFRGIGDSRSPMWISGIQIVIHIVLNLFLINPPTRVMLPWLQSVSGAPATIVFPGLGWGLPGAMIALSLSSFISLAIYLAWAARSQLEGKFEIKLPDREWLRRILNIAVPSAMQAILRVLSFTAFTVILRNTPDAGDALAALRIGIAIEAIMFMPAFGLSVAASALVGQSLGAKDPNRAEKLGWISAHYAALVILILSIPIFIFANPIAGLLTGFDKPTIQADAAGYIRWIIATEVLFGYAMVLIGAIQGAGDTRRTLWITIISLWGIRVPLAFILAGPIGLGATGCWIAMSLSQAVQGLMAMGAFKGGRWKTFKV